MTARLATWVVFMCLVVLMITEFGTLYYSGLQSDASYFGFPNALPDILVRGASTVSVFCVVQIVLLVSSEFDWRTSRQNIIDGLSKNQWFAAKLLLLPTVALFFYGFQTAFAGTLAWLGTDAGIDNAYQLSGVHFLAFAGVLLGILCYSSIALFVSLVTRSAGPALGIALIYPIFETLVARALRSYELEWLADWLPYQVQSALFRFEQYLPQGSVERGRLESSWDIGTLLIADVSWVVLILLASYFVYQKKDL